MPRRPYVPDEPLHGPFTVGEALAAGVSRRALEGGAWRRLLPGVHCAATLPDSVDLRLRAAGLVVPAGAAVTGPASLWARGLLQPRDLGELIDVVVPLGASMRPKPGLHVVRAKLRDEDVEVISGLPVSRPERAVIDAARRLSLVETTVVIDAVLHAELVSAPWLDAYLASRARARGIVRAREALDLASVRAASPMETRLRLLYVLDGFPVPLVNQAVHDMVGRLVGVPDLLFVRTRLHGPDRAFGVEYDGRYHDDESVLHYDLSRENLFVGLGIPLLRYGSHAYYRTPQRILAEGWRMWHSL